MILLPQFWNGYRGTGEPYGLINLKLAREIGRQGEQEHPDPEVCGFNPCAEQGLAPYETCCLAEIHLPNIETKEELLEVAQFLYRINKHSLRLDCHHKETEEIVHKNMRMGIGITGYCMSTEEQKSWLPECYGLLRAFDKGYSRQMGWPESIKLTTVKPSGTLSLLSGVTSGGHPGYSQYYIRRIRIAANSPLIEVIKSHGYKTEFQKKFDGTDDHETIVCEFPCKLPDHTIFSSDIDAIGQLEIVKRLQKDWSDNSVSVTIYYKKEELDSIKEYLNENYNESFKTLSFLLHSEHGFLQAPLEEITREQYEEASAKVSPISFVSFQEGDIEGSQLSCESGACPIK